MVGATSPVKENNEWSTPDWFYNYFNNIYQFKVDLAANRYNSKCISHYDKALDSLIQDWHLIDGWCWLNPPYGRHLHEWIEKAYHEMQLGAKIIMLIPASTGTSYWAKWIWNKVPKIYFIEGRIRFVDPLSKTTDPPKYDSAVIVFQVDLIVYIQNVNLFH